MLKEGGLGAGRETSRVCVWMPGDEYWVREERQFIIGFDKILVVANVLGE